jgi:hypothetical protein
MILPSEAVVNRSRWSGYRAITDTTASGRAVRVPSGNQPDHPDRSSHQQLYTRLSVPTVNTSRWNGYRAIAVTLAPLAATPPDTWNQLGCQPDLASHQVDMTRPSDAVLNRSRWSE